MRNSILQVVRRGKWLIARFSEPQVFLSWAIVGGGTKRGGTVAWYEVSGADLRETVDPKQFLEERLREEGLSDAVGFLTSRNLDSYVDLEKSCEGVSVRVIATVGLSNALRVGDPPSPKAQVGTINFLCHVLAPLSEEAFLEALSVAAEARTAAILEVAVESTLTSSPATGTGTDCIVIAAPEGKQTAKYAGKHTVLGHLIGSVVTEAIFQAAHLWKKDCRPINSQKISIHL